MKIKTIYDSGIQNAHSNGGWKQQLILTNDKNEQYKISILSESMEAQSYASLYKWSDSSGWNLVIKKSPSRDFNIDVSYQRDTNKNAFKPIIDNLKAYITIF